ncbi:WD40/YVTN/BNR-like repeat-containing protein [Janthinobacterium sp. HLX7-2]|uniref:WD40/YVTN/BNR-like repeat-containing protein n=1 Tax=Janthinobacterium sp. HLX7-2 TaxID=1259331 RepID=UPI003F25CD8F
MRFVQIFCCKVVLGMVACASPLYASAEKSETDPLNRAALISPRAGKLVQLHVALAGKRLVSVGERGSIMLSDDSGKSWRQTGAPVSVTLTSVTFVDVAHGWAVGHSGVVLASSDGGITWARQLDGRAAAQIEANAAHAAAERSGAQGVRRIANAERLVEEGPDKPFFDVHFFDQKSGMVVGAYGLAFMTADGGQTWESLAARINDPKGRHLYAVHAAGPHLYLAGEQGALYRSDDQGRTFSALAIPSTATFFGMAGGETGPLIAFGLRGNAWRSTDGGASWDKLKMDPVSLTAGGRLRDGSLVLADEAGRVLRSADAGNTFQMVAAARSSPYTSLVHAADGALVMSSLGGLSRIVLVKPSQESAK